MREAAEAGVWGELQKRFRSIASEPVSAAGVLIDVALPCTILGGRNGAGKSRVLRALNAELWVELHPSESTQFRDDLSEKLLALRPRR